MSRGALQKTLNTCAPLLFNKNTWFWPLLVAPVRPLHVPPENTFRGPQRDTRAPFENPDLETRAANVWDLVQSDQ